MLFLRHMLVVSVIFAFNLPVHAAGNASEASRNASAALSAGIGSVIEGSVILSGASGMFVVESVEKTAQGVVIVLHGVSQGASEAGRFSLRVTGDVAGAASVVAGSAVQLVAEASGTAVTASGKLIAFIPNEIGQSLVHHSRVDGQDKP